MVKVAVTGIGFMGRAHLKNYGLLENVEIAAVCDVREEALALETLETGGNIDAAGGSFDASGVRKYTDFDRMLKEGGFDIVDICLPTYLHAKHVIKALEAGYHVFCEKPLAMTNEETAAIRETVQRTGRLFGVGQCLRYWPPYLVVKELIDSGKYGKVRYAEFSRFSLTPVWSWDNWLLDSKRSRNAAFDLHIHDVDMVLFLFGMPQAVRSRGVKEKDGGFSHITTLYRYPELDVTSTGGWICTRSYGFVMKAFFVMEGATVEINFASDPIVMVYPGEGEKYPLAFQDGDGYFHELKAFTEGVEKGRFEGPITAEAGSASVKLALFEIESARREEELTVPAM